VLCYIERFASAFDFKKASLIKTDKSLARPEGRNQTKKLKCKTQNFGIPASRDNSLLSKQLRQPCRKNTHKKQEIERLYYKVTSNIQLRNKGDNNEST